MKQKRPPGLESARPILAVGANRKDLAVMMYEGLKMKYKAGASKTTVQLLAFDTEAPVIASCIHTGTYTYQYYYHAHSNPVT